jgi:speckle-type POZ protein
VCKTKEGEATKEKKFPAHKAVLGARSLVFSAMFSHSDLKETAGSEVVIEDVDGNAMQIFLEFIYGKETFLSDFDTACAVLAAADKYDVPGLLRFVTI